MAFRQRERLDGPINDPELEGIKRRAEIQRALRDVIGPRGEETYSLGFLGERKNRINYEAANAGWEDVVYIRMEIGDPRKNLGNVQSGDREWIAMFNRLKQQFRGEGRATTEDKVVAHMYIHANKISADIFTETLDYGSMQPRAVEHNAVIISLPTDPAMDMTPSQTGMPGVWMTPLPHLYLPSSCITNVEVMHVDDMFEHAAKRSNIPQSRRVALAA